MTGLGAEVRQVAVGDVTLAWEEHGAGERPLVLVHGFTGSRDDWSGVVGDLAAFGRTVIYDQRGHGASSKLGREGAYTLDDLVEDLHRFLSEVGIDRCDLLGHSLGGGVTLRYVLAHPERVASLILMDTTARPVPEVTSPLELAAEAVRIHGIGWMVDLVTGQPFQDEDALIAARIGEDVHRRRLRAQLGSMDAAAFIGLVTAVADHAPVSARLGEIRCPTTVLVGEYDLPFRAPSTELAAGIAGGELVVIPGAWHSPQKSATDLWLDAVRHHLKWARG